MSRTTQLIDQCRYSVLATIEREQRLGDPVHSMTGIQVHSTLRKQLDQELNAGVVYDTLRMLARTKHVAHDTADWRYVIQPSGREFVEQHRRDLGKASTEQVTAAFEGVSKVRHLMHLFEPVINSPQPAPAAVRPEILSPMHRNVLRVASDLELDGLDVNAASIRAGLSKQMPKPVSAIRVSSAVHVLAGRELIAMESGVRARLNEAAPLALTAAGRKITNEMPTMIEPMRQGLFGGVSGRSILNVLTGGRLGRGGSAATSISI